MRPTRRPEAPRRHARLVRLQGTQLKKEEDRQKYTRASLHLRCFSATVTPEEKSARNKKGSKETTAGVWLLAAGRSGGLFYVASTNFFLFLRSLARPAPLPGFLRCYFIFSAQEIWWRQPHTTDLCFILCVIFFKADDPRHRFHLQCRKMSSVLLPLPLPINEMLSVLPFNQRLRLFFRHRGYLAILSRDAK